MEPLRLAFIGYNTAQTMWFFREFAELNCNEVKEINIRRKQIICNDGTIIQAITSEQDVIGRWFDQIIEVRDRRGGRSSPFIWDVLERITQRVPEEFRELVYDIDSREKGN